MKQKTVDCLKLASMKLGSTGRREFLNSILSNYSEKVVLRKLQELVKKGYVNKNGSLVTSTLTPKGEELLLKEQAFLSTITE